MITVSGVTLPFESAEDDAFTSALAEAGVGRESVNSRRVSRLSFDLRRGRLRKVWSVELDLGAAEERILARGAPNIRKTPTGKMPRPGGAERPDAPPVVIGFGPAGLFAALVLAENGYRPRVLERGAPIARRDAAVDLFNKTGALDTDSNVQFGEGGAGAYSDGKLTTRINDPRCALALNLLRRHGAPDDALRAAKPHIGTDVLKGIVISMRERIIELGGSVDFGVKVTGLDIAHGALRAVRTERGELACSVAVLAIGHSARDTFEMLSALGVEMRPKAFSAGVRIEHPQAMIDEALYGRFAGTRGLPPGEYALANTVGTRGCYSFCMCPGGVLSAAASEAGGVVTNGMSFHARDLPNANSALCVTVNPQDCGAGLFAGAAFQRALERAAFELGGGGFKAPAQRLGNFLTGASVKNKTVEPTYPRGVEYRDLRGILPGFISGTIASSVGVFARKIRGFDRADAVLTGVETRTSSPVRIVRGGDMNSSAVRGLIPCGEGAGYAGGIMSAAADGIRAAESIMARYAPLR